MDPQNGQWLCRFPSRPEEQLSLNLASGHRLLSAKLRKQDITKKMALPLVRTEKTIGSVPFWFPPKQGQVLENICRKFSGVEMYNDQVNSSSHRLKKLSPILQTV